MGINQSLKISTPSRLKEKSGYFNLDAELGPGITPQTSYHKLASSPSGLQAEFIALWSENHESIINFKLFPHLHLSKRPRRNKPKASLEGFIVFHTSNKSYKYSS